MAGRGGRRNIAGGQHNATRAKVCGVCDGFVPYDKQQCVHCGSLTFIKFDSTAEMKRYGELRLLEKVGQIEKLTCQPRYDLHANHEKLGAYVADFSYMEPGKGLIVEDVKGGDAKGYVDTSLARWKRKHFEAEYSLTVSIIKR